jgi:hypothetical protein
LFHDSEKGAGIDAARIRLPVTQPTPLHLLLRFSASYPSFSNDG